MKRIMMGTAMLWLAHTLTAQTTLLSDSIQEVVVTGTGTQHLLKNAPVQTEVITRRMLQQYGGGSLQDILSGLTASFAFNEGDMGSQMQMNGLGNSYILILVDGKRLHGDNGGENDLSLIDPHNIEKIEIVKGASSALYGSDAIAGVINIITRKQQNDALNIELTQRLGSFGESRRNASLAFALGKFKSYTHYQGYNSDGWQNTSVEDRRQTEFLITDSRNMTVNANRHWQVSQRFTYTPVKSLEFYGEASTYWKRIYRPKGTHPGVDIKTYDLAYRNQSAAIGGKWLHGLTDSKTDAITLDVDWNRHAYYYEYTAFTLTEGYDPNGQLTPYYPYFEGDEEVQSDQRCTMAHLKGVFSLPFENRLSAGAEWRYDLLKAPMRVVNGRVEDHTEALYLQDEWSHACSDAVAINLTAGLRLTNNGKFGRRLTPKVSGMLSIGDHWRLRATWSQGFKTPTPKELHYRYVRNMGGTILCIGNTSLKPQTSNYYALSGEWDWKGLNVTLTGYLNDVDDMITLVTVPVWHAPAYYIEMYDPTKTRQYQNLETAKTRGVDFSVRYRIAPEWTAGLSYSYLDTDAQQYDTDKEQLQKVVIDGYARHKGSCYATWNHTFAKKYKLGIGIYGRMSSTRYYQINGNGKGYQLWRLTTTHEVGSKGACRIEAGVDNVFNYVDRTPHGLHLGTTTAGRTVYASLTLRLNWGKKLNFTTNNKSNLNQRNNEED